MPPLAQSERLARLRLIRSENVGPVTFLKLLNRFGSAKAALDALPGLAKKGGKPKPIKICSRAEAVREIEAAQKIGARPLILGDPDYPPMLGAIDDPPIVTYAKGNEALLTRRSVAFVGARNASLNGLRLAEKMSKELGDAGFIVVSGMARGLDAAAHRGALETGTIAVLAGGVDVVYPKENSELYDELTQRGLILSEMPPGTVPQARHFPKRNRIISGLSEAVVVVEATLKSGSLITARFAAEQGREVFALPGSPLDPRAKGGNDLIRQGAVLCESAEDIIRELHQLAPTRLEERRKQTHSGQSSNAPTEIADAARNRIYQLLSPDPVNIDQLIAESGFSTDIVLTILLEMELAGRVETRPGNQVCLISFVE